MTNTAADTIPSPRTTLHVLALDALGDRDYAAAKSDWYQTLQLRQKEKKKMCIVTKATVDSGFVDEDDLATLRVRLASTPSRVAAKAGNSASSPSPPHSPYLHEDRDYFSAETELARLRARAAAATPVRHTCSGDRDYRIAADELAAYRTRQKAAPSPFLSAHLPPSQSMLDSRDIYSAEAELAAFRATKEAAALVLRESNVDRWGYDAVSAELAQFRERQNGKETSTSNPTQKTLVSTFKENVAHGASVDSRHFHVAGVELAAFRAKQVALEDKVDRGYGAAAAELAAFRSKEAGNHGTQPAPLPPRNAAPAPHKAPIAVPGGEFADIDSRNFFSAEIDLAAFRKQH